MSKWSVRQVSKKPKIELTECDGTDNCGCENCLLLISESDTERRRGSVTVDGESGKDIGGYLSSA